MCKKYISIGSCSRFYFYILGSVIFKFLEIILLGYTREKDQKEISIYGFVPILNDFNFSKSLYCYFGCIIFGILFHLISNIKEKSDVENTNKNVVPKGIIHNKAKKKKSKKLHFSIFIFSLLYILHSEIKKVLYNLDFQAFNIWTLDIIFMLIFLKKYFIIDSYKHQKYSIRFIIISGTLLLIASSFLPFKVEDGEKINTYSVTKEKGSYFYAIPLYLGFTILSCAFSYVRVSGKVLMQKRYISPYVLIIFIGISGFVCTLIATLLSKLLGYDDNIFDYFDELKDVLDKNEKYEFYFEIIGVNILYSFICFMEIAFELLTIYYLNPIFNLITNNLCYGVMQLITFIIEYESDYGILVIMQFLCEEMSEVFAFLGYIVYLEIIELEFLGLNENLRNRIILRGEYELKDSLQLIEENEQENENENEEKEDNNNAIYPNSLSSNSNNL